MITTIIFHHDDLDGVISALLIYDYLIEAVKLKDENIQIQPMNYEKIDRWRATSYENYEVWVVDFPPHPDADFWFDHHATNENYPNKSTFFLDKNSPSAASAIYRILESGFKYIEENYKDIVIWTDVVDSASYDHPGDAYDFSHHSGTMTLANILRLDEAKLISSDIVRQLFKLKNSSEKNLINRMIDSIPKLRDLKVEAIKATEYGKKYVESKTFSILDIPEISCMIEKEVVDGNPVIVHALMVYDTTPMTEFCVSIRGNGKISISRNVWLENPEFESLHLGNYMKNYWGGGGHKDAAGGRTEKSPEDIINKIKDDIKSIYAKKETLMEETFLKNLISKALHRERQIEEEETLRENIRIEVQKLIYGESDIAVVAGYNDVIKDISEVIPIDQGEDDIEDTFENKRKETSFEEIDDEETLSDHWYGDKEFDGVDGKKRKKDNKQIVVEENPEGECVEEAACVCNECSKTFTVTEMKTLLNEQIDEENPTIIVCRNARCPLCKSRLATYPGYPGTIGTN